MIQLPTRRTKKPTALDYMQRYYNRIIIWAMQHRKKVLISGVLAFVAGIGILSLVRQQFFPLAERDQFVMDVWLPEGTRIEATDAAVRRIEGALSKEKEVRSYTTFLGLQLSAFLLQRQPACPQSQLRTDAGQYAYREGHAEAGWSSFAKNCRSWRPRPKCSSRNCNRAMSWRRRSRCAS